MKNKTGIYIVSGGVVVFSSTVAQGSNLAADAYVTFLAQEITRVYTYWISRSGPHPAISKALLCGKGTEALASILGEHIAQTVKTVEVADVWGNALDIKHYVPPITKEDSLDYAVASGLALYS
jgi:hypothetical protein